MSSRSLPPDMTPESEASFFQSLTGEDVLGVVVRAAAQVDYQLVKLIEEASVNPAALGSQSDWTYEQRIKISIAMGLDPRLARPLKAFGGIRNKFAHQVGYSLSEADINNLYKSFHEHEKQVINEVYIRARDTFPDRPKNISSLPSFSRLQIYMVSLRNVIVAARIQLSRS